MTYADVTPPLGEFVTEYERDDNVWWTISCGHHQNLFDAALERIAELERGVNDQRTELVTLIMGRTATSAANAILTCYELVPRGGRQ